MELLQEILAVTYQVMRIYYYIMIITIILSWLPIRDSGVFRALYRLTAPYLNIFRGWLVIRGIDLSPIIGLLFYRFVMFMLRNAIF